MIDYNKLMDVFRMVKSDLPSDEMLEIIAKDIVAQIHSGEWEEGK